MGKHLEPIIITCGAQNERNHSRIRYGLTWARTHLANLLEPAQTFTPNVYHDRSSTLGLTIEKVAWQLNWRSTSFRHEWEQRGPEASADRDSRMIRAALHNVENSDLVVCVAFPLANGGNAWDCVRHALRREVHCLIVPFTETEGRIDGR